MYRKSGCPVYNSPTPTAIRICEETGDPYCRMPDCSNYAVQAHHGLYGARRGKHPIPGLDMDENLFPVCLKCHDGPAKTPDAKLYFWITHCERFGYDHMVKWHEDLPMIGKEFMYR